MPRVSRDFVAGGVLLIVGAYFVTVELLPEQAFLIPMVLGLILLGIFLLVRSPGLLGAGGVISGVGVGILVARQGSPDFGGAGVLISIGGGLLLVSILAAIFEVRSARAWPIAPGLAFITVGAVIYAAGLGRQALDFATRGWPVLLIAIGAYLLLAARLRLPLYAGDEEREKPAPVPEETDHGSEPPRARDSESDTSARG
jgi:hypothetical protein